MTTEAELCDLSRKVEIAIGNARLITDRAQFATDPKLIGEMLEWLGEDFVHLNRRRSGCWAAESCLWTADDGAVSSLGTTPQEALARLVVAVAEARNAKP
jgi:hypothetical protein